MAEKETELLTGIKRDAEEIKRDINEIKIHLAEVVVRINGLPNTCVTHRVAIGSLKARMTLITVLVTGLLLAIVGAVVAVIF